MLSKPEYSPPILKLISYVEFLWNIQQTPEEGLKRLAAPRTRRGNRIGNEWTFMRKGKKCNPL